MQISQCVARGCAELSGFGEWSAFQYAINEWRALALTPMARALALVWGLIWASFVNVVIYRLPHERSVVKGGSRCGECGEAVRWFDNIPVVSYLLLRGKCRACGATFSARYMVVELIGGVLSLSLYMKFVVAPLLLASGDESLLLWLGSFVFALSLVAIVFIDLDYWFIPDEIVLPMAALGCLFNAVIDWPGGGPWWHGAVAGVVACGLFAALRQFYIWRRGIEALGLGDAKLMLMVGAWLGPAGVAWTVGGGAIQGLLISVPLLALGRSVASRDLSEVIEEEGDPLLSDAGDEQGVMAQRVPFGPFLALASLEWLLLSSTLAELIGVAVSGLERML